MFEIQQRTFNIEILFFSNVRGNFMKCKFYEKWQGGDINREIEKGGKDEYSEREKERSCKKL